MISRRVILLLYIVLFSTFTLVGGALWLEARAEYGQLKEVERGLQQRLAKTQAELDKQQRILDRLNTDPKFIEKVTRQRLHYAKPGEMIFRFED